MGDPLSINSRLVDYSLASTGLDVPVILVGSYEQWKYQKKEFDIQLEVAIKSEALTDFFDQPPGLYFWDIGGSGEDPRKMVEAQRGKMSVDALYALKQIPTNLKVAVVTMPINKYAATLAKFTFPGQTEYFENLWGQSGIMVLAGAKLRVGLVTNHEPLRSVTDLITSELLKEKAYAFRSTLKSMGIAEPRIAVCGINPHCGDNGLFGAEDTAIVKPTIESLKKEGMAIDGPLPADTAFYFQMHGHYDGVLAQYHDQGLGPLKTVHFDSAVNITGGLKNLRVSPDHGPASDLFESAEIGYISTQEAFGLALRFLKNKT